MPRAGLSFGTALRYDLGDHGRRQRRVRGRDLSPPPRLRPLRGDRLPRRVGVVQLLLMSDRLEQLAAEKAPRAEIERAAAEEGMRTMWEDGVGKVAAGITSAEELARVCTV